MDIPPQGGVFHFVGECGKIGATVPDKKGAKKGKQMKRTRAQIKAQMMKRVEKEIDELLDWREGSAPPNLSQFEEEILQARQGISQAMIEGMLSGEENQGPVEAAACLKRQVQMENKGQRDKVIETRLGTLRMRREYYACPEYGDGFFLILIETRGEDSEYWASQPDPQAEFLTGIRRFKRKTRLTARFRVVHHR